MHCAVEGCNVCNCGETVNGANVLEQYIGHINRVCCAADIRNCTDGNNYCYDIAEGTVWRYRILRDCYWVN